jgi:uncharacterized membrane protein HdeD (DUF308 family)
VTPKNILKLVLGVVMVVLGLYIAVRPMFTNNAILTGSRWLDATFSFVFMLRGAMNVRSVMRAKAADGR